MYFLGVIPSASISFWEPVTYMFRQTAATASDTETETVFFFFFQTRSCIMWL